MIEILAFDENLYKEIVSKGIIAPIESEVGETSEL